MSSWPTLDAIAKNIEIKTGKHAGMLEACQAVRAALDIGIPLDNDFENEYGHFMDNMRKLLGPKEEA